MFEALSADDNNQQKALLDRFVAMLTKLGQRGYAVREELGEYRASQFDITCEPMRLPMPTDGSMRSSMRSTCSSVTH